MKCLGIQRSLSQLIIESLKANGGNRKSGLRAGREGMREKTIELAVIARIGSIRKCHRRKCNQSNVGGIEDNLAIMKITMSKERRK